MSRVFEEHDYIGLSEVSSVEDQTSDKSKNSAFSDKNNTKILNFKSTELRLGLPGSQSPENGDDDNDKNGDDFSYKLAKFNSFVSGAKRGFSDAINGASNNWGSSENGGSDTSCVKNEEKKLQNSPVSVQPANSVLASSKAQVVGWPPIRSFRKNSMAISSPKTNDSNKDSNKDSKSESGCLFVKVSMDGAPYLRKINLGTYGGYVELSSALEKMFSGFTVGQVDFSKGRLMDNLRHSEYVLTYEDKDGDWMLVGDVPWNMFLETCRRLRIMKSSDAVGLASRASEE